MIFRTSEYFYSALQVETKITLGTVTEFFLEMHPAILTVGVRQQMENGCFGDTLITGKYFIEGLPTVSFSCKQMYAAGNSEDIFPGKLITLGSDVIDHLCYEIVDSVVIAGNDNVLLLRHVFLPRA